MGHAVRTTIVAVRMYVCGAALRLFSSSGTARQVLSCRETVT